MIHFLMTISDDPLMWVRTENFLYTLPKKYFVTLVITGVKNTTNDLLFYNQYLCKKIKKEKPFLKNYDLIFSSINHNLHPPVRWHIRNKFKNCIFVDCDMFLCSDLIEFEKDIDYLGGVIAYDCPLSLDDWKELFLYFNLKFPKETYVTYSTKKECPFYINFGFIVTNEEIKENVKNKFYFNLQKIKNIEKFKNNYFLAQLALTITVYQLNVKFKELPLRYNFPDYKNFENFYPHEFENIKIFHSLNKKPDFFKLTDFYDYKKNMTHFQQNKLSEVFKRINYKKFKHLI